MMMNIAKVFKNLNFKGKKDGEESKMTNQIKSQISEDLRSRDSSRVPDSKLTTYRTIKFANQELINS